MTKAARKIAFYLPSLRGGGAERVMLDVATRLSHQNFDVDFVLVKAEGPYVELISKGVRLIDLNSGRSIMSFPKLIQYLRRERPDILFSTLTRTNLLALIAKKFFRRDLPVIIRLADTLTMESRYGNYMDKIAVWLAKRLFPMADAIVANSVGVADDLTRCAPKASNLVRVITNPVVSFDITDKATLPINHPWFEDSSVPIILSAGRLVPKKDYPTLLRAFAEVVKTQQVRLVILGEGPSKCGLLAFARELGIDHLVDFPGFETNPFPFMAKAEVFVLSSRFEGLPNVLIQAMACGTAVVSTDCDNGPREILEDGKWGNLVPVGDWHALAQAIVTTLQRPTSRDSLISRANVYSEDVAMDGYIELFNWALALHE